VDVDILKPDTGALQIERPLHSSSRGTSGSERQGSSSGVLTPDSSGRGYAEPVSEGEEDEQMDMMPGKLTSALHGDDVHIAPSAKNEGARIGLAEADIAAAVAFREKQLKEREHRIEQNEVAKSAVKARDAAIDEGETADDEGEVNERTPFLKQRKQSGRVLALDEAKARALSIDPLAPSSAFDETLRDRLREDAERQKQQEQIEEDEEDEEERRQVGPSQRAMRESERLLERNWRAPAGKKIAVPVRIEPKVYFATERTFLVSPIVFLPPAWH
jgi:hypothetical protein